MVYSDSSRPATVVAHFSWLEPHLLVSLGGCTLSRQPQPNTPDTHQVWTTCAPLRLKHLQKRRADLPCVSPHLPVPLANCLGMLSAESTRMSAFVAGRLCYEATLQRFARLGPAKPAVAPAAPAAAVSMHAPSGQRQALLWPLATLECPPQGLCPRCWLSQLITSNAGAPGGEHPGLHRGNCAQGWGYPGDPRVLPHLPP
jgi:hypothetical protein